MYGSQQGRFQGNQGVPPQQESVPAQNSENRQLQWVMESLAKLEHSHNNLSTKIDMRIDGIEEKLTNATSHLDTKIQGHQQRIDERLDIKHTALEGKIDTHTQLFTTKMENCELKIHNKIAESRITTIKWFVGLLIAVPGAGWMLIQIASKILTK
ncbi:hypothetical protein [Serratia liquefaciens]|uniref:DUF1640 domain-containing protein n=1 Tax=Serratia liquefaciens TaxID=614 RepID=A0A515CTT5_SERLI|nr:hypothetical protein [Serratia liquefaciens]QDL31500.1 hypothetical protein EGO53_06765 [Serratia liquefaciens]